MKFLQVLTEEQARKAREDQLERIGSLISKLAQTEEDWRILNGIQDILEGWELARSRRGTYG